MTENVKEVQLATADKDAGITALGKRKEIRELVQRLKLMAPGGLKLNDNEALALAQYSYSMGLNPLRGEAWFLKTKDGKPLGMMVGIAGYRRKAQDQANSRGDSYWIEQDKIDDPDERARYLIPEGALAVRTKLFERSKVGAYATNAVKLAQAGFSAAEIKDTLGTKPCMIGISWVLKSEMASLERGKLQMPHIQRAEKRSEAHALKKAFHIPFGFNSFETTNDGPILLDEYVVDGDWTDVTPEEVAEVKEEEKMEQSSRAREALFGEKDDNDNRRGNYDWSESKMNAIKDSFPPADRQPDFLNAVLNLSPYQPKDSIKKIQAWVKTYSSARYDLAMDVKSAQKFADNQTKEGER